MGEQVFMACSVCPLYMLSLLQEELERERDEAQKQVQDVRERAEVNVHM